MAAFHRRLHHPQSTGPYFVTWRLTQSLPVSAVADLLTTDGAKFRAADRLLDATATGPRWLEIPEVATAVINTLLQGATTSRYELGAWVIMPNHVHCVIHPAAELGPAMSWLKASSARDANRLLNRTGLPFWAKDYHDHVIRDRTESGSITRYIENNPVKASLCGTPESWPWSSAYTRR